MKTAAEIEATIRANVGMSAGFDFQVTAVGSDWAELHIPFADKLTRLGGTISGPVMMTAADTAMYAVVMRVSENGQFGVTSHMNIEFLNRPPAAAAVAAPRAARAGAGASVGLV